jgi:hypothetical protein
MSSDPSNPFYYITAVSSTKKDVIRDMVDPEYGLSVYNRWLTNKSFSYFIDGVFYANAMNIKWELDPLMQYDFYMHSLTKKNRFTSHVKQNYSDDVKIVSSYYNINNRKAEDIIRVMTPNKLQEFMEDIKKKVDTGGL